jgi:integrase
MPRRSVLPGFRFDGKAGRAFFEVTLPGTGGRRRKRRTVAVSTRDGALSLFRKFREEALAGRASDPKLFSEFVARFWPLIKMRLGSKTATRENYVVKKILDPFFGSYRLDKINTALIRDFAALLRSRSYAPATINGTVSILRKLLNDAVAREVIREFPAKGRLPREKEPILRLEFSDDEKSRFLQAFDNEPGFREHFARHRSKGRVVFSPSFPTAPRIFGGSLRIEGEALGFYFQRFNEAKPLFVIALETGLRRGDLLGLKWSSADLTEGWIRVSVRKTSREALIPISTACREALLAYRQRRAMNDLVFVNGEGKSFPWTTVQRYFEIAKRIAGITRRFRFHDLRHTFGSTLASRGVSLQVIAKALGHASVRMSERYARPSEESLQAIKRALDA